MRRLTAFIMIFTLVLASFSLPAKAATNYETLFNKKNIWLNTTRPLTAADAKGRMVLLDFWTYGCINCMQIVPDLKALEKQFGEKLLIIGVHSAKFAGERGSQRIEAAAKRFGLTHPVINDSDFTVWKAFNVQAWPTLVLLDDKGNIFSTYAGEGHRDDLARDIAAGIQNITPVKTMTDLAALAEKNKSNAILSFPSRLGFAKDSPWGDLIFIADSGHNRLLGVTLDGAIKVTIGSGQEGHKDGDFKVASFNHPRGFGVVKDGIYVADTSNHLIRYIDFKNKTVNRVAGTGQQGYNRRVKNAEALSTPLASPWDAKMMADGKTLAIAMAGLHQIWMLNTATHKITATIGSGREDIQDGAAAEAALAQPSGLSVLDDTLYFVDAESSSLRKLTKDGDVKTLVGTGLFDFGLVNGAYPKAQLQHAQGLDADSGRIVVADTYNNVLRIYTPATGVLSTLTLPKGTLKEPGDVLQLNGKIFVADTNDNAIKVVDAAKGTITPLTLK